MRKALRFLVVLALAAALYPHSAQAQYFGRNKVQWEDFHFKVLRTEHFDIYYYEQESDVVNDVGRMAERWYSRLSRVFGHTFNRKPIVLYANSADFQQTTTTGGLIGEGTGGFTDEFMNRVVLPLTGDYAENDHVLGHELVHVFQYDIASSQTNNRRRFNLEQMPLWLVEGMAEYFSKGRVDPLTSMWIRDATINDRLPDLKKLTRDPRYFPYRYGEALLAYIGGRFGDEAVVRYFLAAGMVGIEPGFERVLGLSAKQVFTDWQESARELYNPALQARTLEPTAQPLIGRRPEKKSRSAGELNVGPAISPDGRYIAFLSTRELFDIDLFLADAHTGKVVSHLVSSDRDAHYDALRFIDSAGSWAPDSRRLAFVVYEKGDNYIGIVDVDSKKIEHIRVPGLDAITNVAWSPDGHTIAIAGQATGVTDLFLYDLDSKQVRRLTSDRYADLQPSWSPDGRTLAFITDRGQGSDLATLQFRDMQLATIDVQSGEITPMPIFLNAKHINPQYAPDGNSLYFIANPEGIPDVYRYYFSDKHVERVTAVQTGVAGITEMSPALSVAAKTGEVTFSLFEDDNYNIYGIGSSPKGTAVAATTAPEAPRAAVLPPLRATGSVITAYLERPQEGLLPEGTKFEERSYSSALHVAYIGPPTIGVGADRFGVGVGGNLSAYYTDILGRQNFGFTLAGTGGGGYGNFADQIGGELFYLNQSHRFNWGADVTHVPYVAVSAAYGQGPIDTPGGVVIGDIYQEYREVQTIDDVSAVAQYPFSTTRRFEVSGGVQRYTDKLEIETITSIGGNIVDDIVEKQPGGFGINLVKASAAFVGDSSVFGFVSPVRGTRYRYEIESLSGDLKFQTLLADYRKYFFFRPVTLAVRGLHYGRYGSSAEDPRLSQLDLAYSELVRGYEGISFNECTRSGGSGLTCPVYDRLVGSRIASGSLEVRFPLLGMKGYGLINAPAVPTEFEGFFDGGAAWNSGQRPKLQFKTNTPERVPVFSAGIGLRILLAYIPIEVYAAKPFQRPGQGVTYGFNIIPGW
jgi:hypothetical protein